MPHAPGNDFDHAALPRAGVLIVNLGTPAAPTPAAVRRYLAEFLADPRVVELPRLLWLPILHGVVLPLRARRSAHAYAQIWRPDGSPLLALSRRLASGIRAALQARFPDRFAVELAMRYGDPGVEAALARLLQAGSDRLVVLPLYPQYSAATTASTFDALARALAHHRRLPELRFVAQYHDDPGYVRALVAAIQAHWKSHGRGDCLLFSFHGLPERSLRDGDPYHCQCHKTARLVAEALGLAPERWRVAFQSRFGRQEWLKPYTEPTLAELARTGTVDVDVVSAGFAVDCLETLEEIDLRYRAAFLAAGGRRFGYIPCLNDSPAHVEALTGIVLAHAAGWPQCGADFATELAGREAGAARARAMGAPR
ncbi:MAG: ferrochelatase [Gammaproteobacteria bacterium]